MGTGIIILLVIVLAAILLLAMGYLKAPPGHGLHHFRPDASGESSSVRPVGGSPFSSGWTSCPCRSCTVDVKTSEAVPTNEFINVMVDGVANVKVSSDPELLGAGRGEPCWA